MTMEAALALVALSAPITVSIIKLVPRRGSAGNANSGVSRHEFNLFVKGVWTRFDSIQGDIRELRKLVNDRL